MPRSNRRRFLAVLALVTGLAAAVVPLSPASFFPVSPAAATVGSAVEPASFVAVKDGRVVLVDTRTGHVRRVLTARPGAQDSEASITDDGRSVVFVRRAGTQCRDSIGIVALAGGPVHQLVPPTRASLERPQLSRTGDLLGYLRTSCAAGRVNLMTHRLGQAGSHRIPTSAGSDVLDFTLGRRGRLLDVVVATLHAPARVWSIAPTARRLSDGQSLNLPRGWTPHLIAGIGISRYVALELTNDASGRRNVVKVDGRTGRAVGTLAIHLEHSAGELRLDYDASGHHLMVLRQEDVLYRVVAERLVEIGHPFLFATW